jgi:hypothetical protein
MSADLIAKFKSAGATCVAGSLILNRETVALLRANQVIVTPEGEAALQRIDNPPPVLPAVDVSLPAAGLKAPKAPKAKAEKPAAPAIPASEPATPATATDSNLADLSAMLEDK